MRKLLVFLVVLAGLALVADLAGRLWVERRVEDRAAANLEGIGSVDASIDSFPFIGRLAWSGEVTSSSITLRDVTGVGVDLVELRLDIDGAQFDRGSLVRGDRVRLVDVDHVRAVAVVSDRVLSRLLGAVVQLSPDSVEVRTPAGVTAALLRIVDRRLVFGLVDQPEVSVPLPSTDVVPCEPDIVTLDRAIELTCEVDELPPLLVEAVGELTSGAG